LPKVVSKMPSQRRVTRGTNNNSNNKYKQQQLLQLAALSKQTLADNVDTWKRTSSRIAEASRKMRATPVTLLKSQTDRRTDRKTDSRGVEPRPTGAIVNVLESCCCCCCCCDALSTIKYTYFIWAMATHHNHLFLH